MGPAKQRKVRNYEGFHFVSSLYIYIYIIHLYMYGSNNILQQLCYGESIRNVEAKQRLIPHGNAT